MQDRLAEQFSKFEEEARGVEDRESWEALRLRWIGRKQGIVRGLLGRLKEIESTERRDYGQEVNRLKELVETRLAEIDTRLGADERSQAERLAAVDVTLPGRRPAIGSIHPVNLVVWATASPRGRRSKTTTTTSRRSTSPPSTRHATPRTPSFSKTGGC
jgi:phenylalanyl-tRNA synthetase alpha chain